jgi:integrase
MASLGELKSKSQHMKRTNIIAFAELFETTAGIQGDVIQRWLNTRHSVAKNTNASALSDLKGYWQWLVSIKAARKSPDPFEDLILTGRKAEKLKPFPPATVAAMERKARMDGDVQLADWLMAIMYSGMRSEEAATLRKDDIDLQKAVMIVRGTKTENSEDREIPIAKALLPVMRRLVKNAGDDGYLFDLYEDKHGDRGQPMRVRFEPYVRAAGYGKGYGVHSVRRTVATLFESALIPEAIAARIVGHGIYTMTYGTYSGGASLVVKRRAIEKALRYPAR